jgi:SNF2 family DNA or RNA helicase
MRIQYPRSKTTPWQHQIDGWNLSKNHNSYYYAWDMGSGKSKGAIDYCNGINANRTLIICPNKVIPVWPGQFNIHSHDDFAVLPVTKKMGTSAKKAVIIDRHLKRCEQTDRKAAVVINYESCWREPLGPVYNDTGTRIIKKGLFLSHQWDVLIADEAHRIKSPGGKASWMLKRLHNVTDRRLFLSGTPLPHSPLDIYAQFRALDPSVFGTNFSLFKSKYCLMGGYENRQVLEWVNQQELQDKFFSRAHHVSADDCLDLPDSQDIIVTCDLDPKAKAIYDELTSEFIAGVDDGTITVTNALVKLLRQAQIAGGYIIYEKEIGENTTVKKSRIIDNNKIETAVELIKDLPPQEPVAIWFRFTNEIDRMREAINKHFKGKDKRSITEISGRHDRQKDFVDGVWQANTTNTALIQIKSGCEGIDLTAAHYNFYFSMGFSLGEYQQSRKRTLRPGQSRKVFYYHIIVRGTIDRKIIRAMEQKKRVVNSIIDETRKQLGKKSYITTAPDFFNNTKKYATKISL